MTPVRLQRLGTQLQRAPWIVFAVLFIIDGVLVSATVTARVQLDSVKGLYGQSAVSEAPPPFLGYRPDGSPVSYDGVQPLAIWYASTTCPYCKRDLEWDGLAAQLQQRGVKIVILAPGRGLEFPFMETRPLGADQAVFTDNRWLSRYPLSVTPTLLIFSRGQKLVWYKSGMLTPEDPKRALAAFDKASRSAS